MLAKAKPAQFSLTYTNIEGLFVKYDVELPGNVVFFKKLADMIEGYLLENEYLSQSKEPLPELLDSLQTA